MNNTKYTNHLNETTTEKSFNINIGEEKKFLNIISKKLTRDTTLPIIEDNLRSFLDSERITLDNMQEVFTYLHDAEYSNTHYLDTVKFFILNTNMSAIEAIRLTEQIKVENDYMMSVICNHISNIDDGEVA